MEQSMMTEDKRLTTELGNTRKQMDDDYKLKQCSSENTLKDIDALQLVLYQKDKQLQFIREENCLIRNLFNQQITSLLEEIKEKENIIQQLQKFDKFHDVKKENNLDGLTVKLDTVIGEISGMCSAINELLVEARRKRSQSDTKNITLNIRQKGILQISTEE
ncbi:Hypothetical predicted protein [Mytilus galloprovincialis]|uniref:Uncharacterized protein n=1 Tax=Mytilus galloprovincialis TaxID=29158 RepID=A0A8B6F4G3_MYTGA|nr:Hypothetical predicted protein [Mytilus galloprovincialis]VDI44137.1 Hypothetical predicted protein [Mytilus galloprovincialis]